MNLMAFNLPSSYELLLEHLKQQHAECIAKYSMLQKNATTPAEEVRMAEAHGAAKGLFMAICGLTKAMEASK